jgi:hypothetical protein
MRGNIDGEPLKLAMSSRSRVTSAETCRVRLTAA